MTYEAWRTHCVKVVKAPMTIEQLRHDCGRLASAEPPNPEVLLMHAMLALESAQKEAEDWRRQYEAERSASIATISGGRYLDGSPAW